MNHGPPKGVAPPQLEGRRTGRPKGSKDWASAWKDCLWGYQNSRNFDAQPPTAAAALWQVFAFENPWEVYDFLKARKVI